MELHWSEHGESCVTALSSPTCWKTPIPLVAPGGEALMLSQRDEALGDLSLFLPSWAPGVSLSLRQRPGVVKSFSSL